MEWTLDRIGIVVGLCVTVITAITPIVVELLDKRSVKKKAQATASPETEVIQGKTVDITNEFVQFLKTTIVEQKEEIAALEQERDAAYLLLMEHGITPISSITKTGMGTTAPVRDLESSRRDPP